jgi:RNA recognition motif-containing protein
MTIFVSNFPDDTTIAPIALLFQDYGAVTAVRLRNGQKRIYAIVEMLNDYRAEEAIRELDGTTWLGKRLDVKASRW